MRCSLMCFMKELLLQPRLQHLASLICRGDRLADIGTDHGYLPVWLIAHGRLDRAIATDIASEPLAHARRTAEEYGVETIDFRLCSGLVGIAPEEADTIVIAGMGGDTIVSILTAAPWTKCGARLLLQPMTKAEMLRGWIAGNGYTFTAESLVRDREYLYPVMEITGGRREKLSAVEEYAGTKLDRHPLYADYLTHQLSRLQKAIDGLNNARDPGCHGRACRLENIREALEEKRKTL